MRDEGVLVMGSGNLVHNLHTYAWGRHKADPFDWAVRFEKRARGLLIAREHELLIDYESLGKDALLSAPTPDHYLPLLYVIALRRENHGGARLYASASLRGLIAGTIETEPSSTAVVWGFRISLDSGYSWPMAGCNPLFLSGPASRLIIN